jgi:hypothetical protein
LTAVEADPHRLGEGLKGSLFKHRAILENPQSACLRKKAGIS